MIVRGSETSGATIRSDEALEIERSGGGGSSHDVGVGQLGSKRA